MFIFPSAVYGVTVVDDVQVDTTWTIQDSPYLLNDPFIIYPGVTLTIDPGVVVKVRSQGVFILRGGNLVASGAANQPIYITSDKDDSVFGDTNLDGNSTMPDKGEWLGIEIESGSRADLDNVFIRYAGGMQFTQSTILNDGILNISSSTLSDGIVGVHNRSGTSVLQKLDVLRHDTGILSTGGDVSIEYSNIEAASVGVINQSSNVISATNNWWNDASGPFHLQLNSSGTGVPVDDNVNFIPWLSGRYASSSQPSLCCSSVLFLPGFMASDLYVQEGISENQLWPPTSLLQQDVDKLRFDSQGNSITSGIYTKNIIEEAFGVNIYKSFADKMRSLVQVQDIEEWLPFPYDWRRDLSEIVNNFTLVKVGNNFENKKLIDEAVSLAQRSPTGKITIIGHSNGGLVGKYLIRELVSQGKGDLVDQFTMVAVPQLGTPKAITGLLHGDGQGFLMRFLLRNNSARDLGFNMKSAHNLLPSSVYFQNNISNVIDFNPSIRNVFDYTLYNFPQTISSYADLVSFVTSANRSGATRDPIDIPLTLRADLINGANADIESLSQWVVPNFINTQQIVGVGGATISGIEYRAKEEVVCATRSGLYGCQSEYFWDRILLRSFDGDGTVMAQSAEYANVNNPNIYFLDIFNSNKNLLINRKHSDILENLNVIELLENIVLSRVTEPLPSYVSQSKPPLSNSYQRISTHSPVSLTVSNGQGEIVGRDPIRDGGDFVFIREDVPNSDYSEINDQKYIIVPMDTAYTVHVKGEGSGIFTLNVDQYNNGNVATQSFIDIPVTESLEAKVDIDTHNVVGDISIDIEGDGVIDTVITPQTEFRPNLYLEIVEDIIGSFDLKKTQESKLLKEINSIREFLKNKKLEKTIERIDKLTKYLNQLLLKEKDRGGFSEDEVQLLIKYLDILNSNLKFK